MCVCVRIYAYYMHIIVALFFNFRDNHSPYVHVYLEYFFFVTVLYYSGVAFAILGHGRTWRRCVNGVPTHDLCKHLQGYRLVITHPRQTQTVVLQSERHSHSHKAAPARRRKTGVGAPEVFLFFFYTFYDIQV